MKGVFNDIINSDTPVLVDFHAEWCGPCKMQAPILKEVAGQFGDKVRIIKIDVDRNQAIASRFSVQAVPTLMLFRRGKQVWRQSGVANKSDLIGILQQNL